MHRFVKQRHVLLVLDDLHRVESGGLVEGARNAGQVAPRLRILISALQTVQPFGLGFRRVPGRRGAGGRRRRPASASVTAAAAGRGEVRPVERADEEALKSAGALEPQPLQIRPAAGEPWAGWRSDALSGAAADCAESCRSEAPPTGRGIPQDRGERRRRLRSAGGPGKDLPAVCERDARGVGRVRPVLGFVAVDGNLVPPLSAIAWSTRAA